jgi:L-aspartate semialdehyde sulfurtransferase ferredoxin
MNHQAQPLRPILESAPHPSPAGHGLRRGTIAGVAKARLHLTFPVRLLSVPVVHRLGTDFGLVTNIRRANLEESGGWIILEVEGDEDRIAEAIAWLADQGLQVDRIED